MIAQQHSDTVLCSAGKGELKRKACLGCALDGMNRCGMDYILLKAILDTKERTGIHVTDLTGCLRKSWFDKTTTAPEYVHAQMYRFMGTIAHGVLEKYGDKDEAEIPLSTMGLEGQADVFRNGRIVDWKCQPAGELVTMADGTEKPIEQICIFDQVLAWTENGFVPAKVTAVLDGGVQDVYAIRIASSQTIRCSGNHPILTVRGWVETKDLIPSQDRVIQLTNWTGTSRELSPDDARLLGYLVGDGGTSDLYSIRFTSADVDDVLVDFRAIAEAHGWSVSHKSQNPKHYDYRIHNQGKKLSTTGPMAFIQQHGLHRKHSYEKEVPAAVLRGDAAVIVNFLGGYFDTDGTITDPLTTKIIPPRATFTTTSPRLAQQTAELLRRLGIACRIHKVNASYKHTSYQICVWRAEDIIKFFSMVPVHCKAKYDRYLGWLPRLQSTLHKGGKNLDRVETVENLGPMQTIGLEVQQYHTYISQGIVTHNTARWLTPSKLPYGSHELQVNIYAEMLRQHGKDVHSAAIQYIDMSGPTKCKRCKVVYQPVNEDGDLACPKCGGISPEAHTGAVLVEIELRDRDEIQQLINGRRDTLLKALSDNVMPDAEPSFLCEYCQFVNLCEI
jgi:CRISPR/Cas system-associated exonuclease Cas4 (RecB family)